MSELEQASKLIGVYHAALDPALWPEVLRTTCDFDSYKAHKQCASSKLVHSRQLASLGK